MFGGIDPSKMQGMMKKLGIKQEVIDSSKVTIDKVDGTKIVINDPQVVRVIMQGQESFQITGDAVEVDGEEEGISGGDIVSLIDKTGKSRDVVVKALEEANGDLAEAIISLS